MTDHGLQAAAVALEWPAVMPALDALHATWGGEFQLHVLSASEARVLAGIEGRRIEAGYLLCRNMPGQAERYAVVTLDGDTMMVYP